MIIILACKVCSQAKILAAFPAAKLEIPQFPRLIWQWKTTRYKTQITENSNSAWEPQGRKEAVKISEFTPSFTPSAFLLWSVVRGGPTRGAKFDPQCVWRALIRVTFFQSCNPLQKWQSPYITLAALRRKRQKGGGGCLHTHTHTTLNFFRALERDHGYFYYLSHGAVCCEPAAWLRREREQKEESRPWNIKGDVERKVSSGKKKQKGTQRFRVFFIFFRSKNTFSRGVG